jgi:hypothetical protein
MNPANYPRPIQDTFTVAYGVLLVRPWVDPTTGPNTNGWIDVGEVDSFKLTVEPTVKDVWTKRGQVSEIIYSAPTKLKMSIDFKVLQRIDWLRAMSLMGTIVPFSQAINSAGVYTVAAAVPGETHYVGAYNGVITSVTTGTGTVIPASNYTLVDFAYTALQFNHNLDVAFAGESVVINYTQPAIVVNEIIGGTNPIQDYQFKLRQVGAIGEKGILDVLHGRPVPKGGQDYITGNDDINGFDFSGAALVDQYGGVQTAAIWRPLTA